MVIFYKKTKLIDRRLLPLEHIITCGLISLLLLPVSQVLATSTCLLTSGGSCTHYRTDSYFSSLNASQAACRALLDRNGYPQTVSCFNFSQFVKTPNWIEAEYGPGVDYPYTLGLFHFAPGCAAGESRHPLKGCLVYDDEKNE